MPGTPDKLRLRTFSMRLARWFFPAILAVCFALTCFSEFERFWWGTYLVAQFRVELFALSFLLCVSLGIIWKSKIHLSLAVLCALLNFSHLVPYYVPQATPQASGRTIKMLELNLNVLNKRYEQVTSYIQNVNADVVVISELTPEWRQYFQTHLLNYPNAITEERIDTYGIGVYSKHPLKNGRIEKIGSSGHPSVIGEFSGLEKPISLLHTHVQGPVKKQFFNWHKEQFEKLLPVVNQLPKPLIMSGDMNSNAWTYLISEFLKESRLKDTQWGRGIHLTWPAWFYWRYGCCPLLSIDHFFVSDDFVIKKRQLGSSIGSDHYPVIIELSLIDR